LASQLISQMRQILFFITITVGVVSGLYLYQTHVQPPTPEIRILNQVKPLEVPVPVQPPVPTPIKPVQPIQVPSPVPSPVAPEPKLDVPDVLKPIFNQAQTADKKVFLFVSQDGCGWCAKMKRDVIPNLNLSGYLFIESKDQSVYKKYNITGLPTIILLDKNGKELKRLVGYHSDIQSFLE
jgi:hypothetical protein